MVFVYFAITECCTLPQPYQQIGTTLKPPTITNNYRQAIAIYMVHLHGMCVVCVWYVCGICVVFVWYLCGICVVLVWYVCCEYAVSVLYVC